MRTKAEAIEHFTYKAPDEGDRARYQKVTEWFVALVDAIYDELPNGPGKTVALRKLADARSAANSCIANKGQ